MLQGLRDIQKIVPGLLSGDEVPDRLIVRPVDMWQGDGEIGALLRDGVFSLDGETLELHGDCWEPAGRSQRWVEYLHGFRWLRDLRACGGAAARQQAQALIQSWAEQYDKGKSFAWRPDLAGERLSLWVSHYEFFGADASDDFNDVFFSSLVRQARHVAKVLQPSYGRDESVAVLRAAKGLLYTGLAIEGREDWVEQSLVILQGALKVQVLGDGTHISRSVFTAVQVLKLVLEVRSALQAGGRPVPGALQDAIARMVPAIKFFRYGDRHFGLFHGTLTGDLGFIDAVLAQAAVRGRAIKALPDGKYEKAVLGRSLLMMDCGAARAHYAPLSFEMAHGKDRIFVNCGSHDADERWSGVLAGSAAHNGLTIDSDYMPRPYQVVEQSRQDGEGFCFMQATHDGFVSHYGVLHKRSLYMAEDGHDLRGEDALIAESPGAGPVQPKIVHVRFHIHPKVLVSLTEDGQSALLRLPGGVGWRFQQVGGYRLRLEDSIYAGDLGEVPRKSQQLVIESAIARDQGDMSVKWALRREGV